MQRGGNRPLGRVKKLALPLIDHATLVAHHHPSMDLWPYLHFGSGIPEAREPLAPLTHLNRCNSAPERGLPLLLLPQQERPSRGWETGLNARQHIR